MEKQWNSIAFPMVKKMAKNNGFSITLPPEAIEMIEKGLIPFGIYGKKRATVCSALILDMLKRPEIREIVRDHMSKKG